MTDWMSPGQQTTRRSAHEYRVRRVVDDAVPEFLATVNRVAAAPDEYTAGLSMGRVLRAWNLSMTRVSPAVLASIPTGEREWYAQTLTTRLMGDPTPEFAWMTATEVVAHAGERRWSNGQMRAALRDALAYSAHPVIRDPDGLVPQPDARTFKAMAHGMARTEATRAYAYGSQKSMAEAGFTEKRWVSHHDKRVRPTHLAADGQTVGIEATFAVGSDRLYYPGDPYGSAAETYGCRCIQVAARD